jgi:hypothetical protein
MQVATAVVPAMADELGAVLWAMGPASNTQTDACVDSRRCDGNVEVGFDVCSDYSAFI